MQKKLYIGGLPWEIDRIGLLNYFKVILESNEIIASYEPQFMSAPLDNPNAAIKLTDVFVAMDRETGKSRGFGFITLELPEDAGDLFTKVIDLMNKKVMLGIRGPRELIVNEAEPRVENGNASAPAPEAEAETEAPAAAESEAEGNGDKAFSLDW